MAAHAATPESDDGDLMARYGEDMASLLYMWRVGGFSFGNSSRFWWVALGAAIAGIVTALGTFLFCIIVKSLQDNTWLDHHLEAGLPYDGSAMDVPDGTTAYGAWGSGEWAWLGWAVMGGGALGCLKLLSSVLTLAFEDHGHHSALFPKLTPNLIVEVGALDGHVIHGFFVLLCGAVSIGCGASVGPEAPNGTFGAGVGKAIHMLFTGRNKETRERGLRQEYVLIGMAAAFANVFPTFICGVMLVLELNIATTILSVAAVEAGLEVLRSSAGEQIRNAAAHRDFELALGSDASRLLPHTKFRFDVVEYVVTTGMACGLGIFLYGYLRDNSALSSSETNGDVEEAAAANLTSTYSLPFDSLYDGLGGSLAQMLEELVERAEAVISRFNVEDQIGQALVSGWEVEQWHYPVACLFGLIGAALGVCGEALTAVFDVVGLRLMAAFDGSALNRKWCAGLKAVLRQREVLSLGQFVLPILGGVLVGLCNVLQPWCLGEGTEFLPILLVASIRRSLTAGTMVGIGFVKLIATRLALSFGFVGGKFFPTIFLGACVGCAIYVWCNPDRTSLADLIEPSDMPLLFPLCCLMTSSVCCLAPLFFSFPLCVAGVAQLTAPQTACIYLNAVSAYFLLHGVGRGLLPIIFRKKLLAAIGSLQAGTEGRSASKEEGSARDVTRVEGPSAAGQGGAA